MSSGTPEAGSPAIRAKMQAQKAKDTKPEMQLRRALHARGLRFRVDAKLPEAGRRTADIAWAGRRIAVFVDGCFWHGCPDHFVLPKSHSRWWQEKIQRNRDRDEDTTRMLLDQGWTVIRIWEHAATSDAASFVQNIVHHEHAASAAPDEPVKSLEGCRAWFPSGMTIEIRQAEEPLPLGEGHRDPLSSPGAERAGMPRGKLGRPRPQPDPYAVPADRFHHSSRTSPATAPGTRPEVADMTDAPRTM